MPKTVIEVNDRDHGPLQSITRESGEAFLKTVLAAAEAKGWICTLAIAGTPTADLGAAAHIRLAGLAGMRGATEDIIETFKMLTEAAITAAVGAGDAKDGLLLAADLARAVHDTARRTSAQALARQAGLSEAAVDAVLRAAMEGESAPPGGV